MTDAPLTPEELEWAKQNAAVIRTAMAAMPSNEDHETAPEEALEKASRLLTKSISEKIARINAKENEVRERIALYKRIADSNTTEVDSISESLHEAENSLLTIATHRSALECKISSLRNKPEDFFLPLGTVVKFVESNQCKDSLELSDRRKDYPVPGSVGVVTGLNVSDEYPLRVSLAQKFKTGWGTTCHSSTENPPTFFVDRDLVEVVGYATFPDGSECREYGFVETHERDDGVGGEDAEMILEADGLFWRLYDFSGTQGIECLGVEEDISEFTWIVGPLDRFKPQPIRGTEPRM